MLLRIVPIAAPSVPNVGMKMRLKRDRERRHHHAEPQRCARIAGGAKRAAQHEENHHPDDAEEHGAEERQRLGLHRRRGVDEIEQRGRRQPPHRPENGRHAGRGQERLIHDTVHLLVIVGAGEPRHEHAHPAEHRARKDDHDQHDLPAHADGGVRRVADEVPDHRVIDDALQSGDDVLQHRGPRDLPDGWTNRAFDERTVERAGFVRGLAHGQANTLT